MNQVFIVKCVDYKTDMEQLKCNHKLCDVCVIERKRIRDKIRRSK